jgi:hypothetical protein
MMEKTTAETRSILHPNSDWIILLKSKFIFIIQVVKQFFDRLNLSWIVIIFNAHTLHEKDIEDKQNQKNDNNPVENTILADWVQLLSMLRDSSNPDEIALLLEEQNEIPLDRFLMRAWKHWRKTSCNSSDIAEHGIHNDGGHFENQNPNDQSNIHASRYFNYPAEERSCRLMILQCFWEIWNHEGLSRSLIKTSIQNCRVLHSWLIQEWQRCLQRRTKDIHTNNSTLESNPTEPSCNFPDDRHDNGHPDDHMEILLWIVKVLSTMCHRDPEIRSSLVQSGMVVSLMEHHFSKACHGNFQVALLNFFKHLTTRGQKDEHWKLFNRLFDPLLLQLGLDIPQETSSMLATHPDDTNDNVSSFPSTDVLEAGSAILWNWAATDSDMALSMADKDRLWKHLEQVWAREYCLSDTVLCNIASTVGTIIASLSRKHLNDVEIEERADRTIFENQTWLIPILLRAFDPERPIADKDYRRRCMRTIRCLSSCTWGRAFLLQNAPSSMHLGNVLTQALRSDLVPDNDTRLQACETVTYLLPTIYQDANFQNAIFFGPSVEMALIQIIEEINRNTELNSETDQKLVLAACRALCVSLRHSPWQRGANCFSHIFLEELFSILQDHPDQPSCHQGFSELMIELLTTSNIAVDDRRQRIPGIASLIASSPPALDLLCMLISATPSADFDISRQNAIRALSLLADESDQNKKALADHDNILTALVNVCLLNNANDDEGSMKYTAKSLVVSLVSKL